METLTDFSVRDAASLRIDRAEASKELWLNSYSQCKSATSAQ